jgi:homoserine kinase
VGEIVRAWVCAFAPATVANVTCGFDLLPSRFRARNKGNVIEARATREPRVHLREITGGGGRLSADPRENKAGVAALKVLESGWQLPWRISSIDDIRRQYRFAMKIPLA